MIPICSPATASRWASPESRNAARSVAGMDSVLPFSKVAATAPAGPGMAAMARRPMVSRTPCTQARHVTGGARAVTATADSAVPPPANPAK